MTDGQGIRLAKGRQHPFDKGAVLFGIRTSGKIERTGLLQVATIFQYPYPALQQRCRVLGIPDSPGINITLLKSGAGIGGGKIHRLDIAEFQACLL